MTENNEQAAKTTAKKTTAVCPGSFDPVTMGHVDIITRAARSFDHVTVLVTANPNKNGLFSVEERMELIRRSVDCDNVSVDAWSDLLVKYTDEHNIDCLVKGLRSSLDYEYELPMAQMNKRLSGIDTYFLLTDEKYGYTSSSLVKEVVRYGGDVSDLLPEPVAKAIAQKFN